ncbi:hypothetical protein E0687_07810 [Thermus tengchongensis]|uniref:Uncharacterized protein n=1 Tax=Thermus tengchongensis TaxID=1214928 RepID=A0A4Y9FAA3_9DEIN|nr:hypothetical protein E0687_07810 [Thermus tengchongensis]
MERLKEAVRLLVEELNPLGVYLFGGRPGGPPAGRPAPSGPGGHLRPTPLPGGAGSRALFGPGAQGLRPPQRGKGCSPAGRAHPGTDLWMMSSLIKPRP